MEPKWLLKDRSPRLSSDWAGLEPARTERVRMHGHRFPKIGGHNDQHLYRCNFRKCGQVMLQYSGIQALLTPYGANKNIRRLNDRGKPPH